MNRHIKLGLIGQNIAHSLSPRLQTRLGEHLGYKVSFDLIDCSRSELLIHLENNLLQNYNGLNVTTPHKRLLYQLIDQSTDAARIIGAVNTLQYLNHKLIGHNTDYIGVNHTLQTHLVASQLSGGHALIVGVGPASRAAAYALILAGIKRITWLSRQITKGRECLEWCTQYFPQLHSSWLGLDGQQLNYCHQDESVDLIISGAPPLSTQAWSEISHQLHPFLGDMFGLNPHSSFFDLNYGESRTDGSSKFSDINNLKYIDGTHMLLTQGIASFLWWNRLEDSIELILSQCDLINKNDF